MKDDDILFSEMPVGTSDSPSMSLKKLEFTCSPTLNVWGGIDLMPQILQAMAIKDPDFHLRMNLFYSALNSEGILNGRCSSAILMDLFFGTEFFGLNPFTVVDEIKSLDGQQSSQTKPETMFKRSHLRGLWHKHYMNGDISSLAQNIQSSLTQYGIPFFDEKVREAQVSGKLTYVTKEDIAKIVDDICTNNLARRRNEGKMTGEWIVYAQHENQNFYLCLAKHKDGDEIIRGKIEHICLQEFPFLASILQGVADKV